MKRKPQFICFSGIDGSGKTTCAEALLQDFQERGLPVKYVWLNAKPLLLAPVRFFTHRTVLKGKDLQGDYISYQRKRRGYASRWRFLRKVYYSIMLFDYLVWVYWSLLPYFFRGVNIICDRYIHDLAVNLGHILGYSAQEEVQFIHRLQRVLPQPSLVLVCDVDEQVALQRKSDTPHISYLTAHRPMYLCIAEEFQLPIIDSSHPLDTVIEQIRAIVNGRAAA